MDLEKIYSQVKDLTLETGDYIRKEIKSFDKKDIEVKGLHNFVTYVDKHSEEKLVKFLAKILPQAGFIAEEGTSAKKGEMFNWVIDPLDGTTNFIHSIPCYAISIGLMQNNEVIMGIVYEINHDECFHALKDGYSFLNDSRITGF